MATTTNYAWETPDDTDLVKDGAAAIRTLGSSIDTTTKALNPSTTLGDIEYRSSTANTNTRLGIGTTGQVLTVASGVPSWASPAAAGGANWTLVNTGGTAMSGAASVTVGSISGKDKILILVKDSTLSSTAGYDVDFRLNGDSGTNYYHSLTQINNPATYNTGTVGGFFAVDTKVGVANFGSGTSSQVNAYALITGCNSSGVKVYQSAGNGTAAGGGANNGAKFAGGYYNSSSTISSITVLSGVNFTGGTVFVYASA